jgi:hypothetical protein
LSAALPELGPSERKLLLRCARIELDSPDEAAIGGLVRERLDWKAIVYHARLHSVAPLVHRHLSRLDDDLVPDAARRQLLAAAHGTAYRSRMFARENAGLAARFDAAGIPVIIPKGISLAEVVYGDLALRPLIDLLFLLSPDRMQAAGAAVLDGGYAAMRVRPPHAAYQWTCPQRRYLKQDDSQLLVLLKTHVIDTPPRRNRFRQEILWPDARPTTITGQTVLMLAPVDQVLYLCLQADANGHFNRAAVGTREPADLMFSGWSNNRLVRFMDIRESARHHREELDWDRLVARARSCGIADAVHANLLLTERALGTTVPSGALQALAGYRRPRMRRTLLGAVAEPPGRLSPRRTVAAAWERLGWRRQKELFRLAALVQFAFPGPRTLRAEREGRSAPSLLGISALHAATTLARSITSLLLASFRDRDAPGWPTPSVKRSATGD